MATNPLEAFQRSLEQARIRSQNKPINEEEGSCNNTGITDEGIFTVANIRTAIAVATAGIDLNNSIKMAKLQEDIAEKYAKLAEDARNYYNEEYKPLELNNIKEVKELKPYDRSKESVIKGQMLLSARDKNAGVIEDKVSCTGRYCTGVRASLINDHLMEQAAIEASMAALAHRYVDDEEIVRNELRWERRKGVLNLGRGIPTDTIAYAELASGVFGSLGKQSGKAAEGIMWWLGHNRNRNDTVYPNKRPPVTANYRKWEKTEIKNERLAKRKLYVPPPIERKSEIIVVDNDTKING